MLNRMRPLAYGESWVKMEFNLSPSSSVLMLSDSKYPEQQG
jgi:hypothetical protein